MKKGLFGVSTFTVLLLYALLAAVVIAVFAILDLPVIGAVIIAVIVLLLQFFISPFFTDLTMKWFYRAKFGAEIPDYLKSFIEKLCSENNMKYPKIGYINDGAPNAFTYGRTKNSARIVLTKGIFDMLGEDEVKAVVAHEMGHAVHYDMLVMTAAGLVPLVLYGIYEMCCRSESSVAKKSSSDSDSGKYLAIVGLIALILYVICEYIILWLSRTREYYADRFSVSVIENPSSLASALVKIGLGLSVAEKPENLKKSTASAATLGISDADSARSYAAASIGSDVSDKQSIKNAMKWDLWNKWATWYEINSTHPLTSKRILAISKYSQECNKEPFVVFDEKKTKSYTGLFIKEVLISSLPTLTMLAAAATSVVMIIHENEAGFLYTGGAAVISMLLSLFKYRYRHPKKFEKREISSLMGEIEVSDVSPVACEIEGEIIGRGDPGCVFNENFVLRDKTGIVLLNYKQPLKTLNKIFALFRSQGYIGKTVKVTGWFRRSPVAYVDMLKFEVDGKVKKLYKYIAGYIFRFVMLLVFLAATILPYIGL